MEFRVEKVLERDIDLLIINKFLSDKSFANLFLSKIQEVDYNIERIEHSLTDENGESDITVIFSKDNIRIALLIENKIDAVAMPNQRYRYDLRGAKGVEKGIYDKFFVFITAPQDYLNENLEAQKYEIRISYEELRTYFANDIFAQSLIDRALEEKKAGYQVIENKAVTQFWSRYYDFVKTNYPMFELNEVSGARGSKAVWPYLKTPIKNVSIIHKSDKGYLDLTFAKMGSHYDIFSKYFDSVIDKDMTIWQTNNSMAIRIKVPIIDFKMSFDDYIQEMGFIMESAKRLTSLLSKVDVYQLYNELRQ